MITIFNRKELTITYSIEQQAKTRTLLATHKIDYKIKIVNRTNSSTLTNIRAHTGTFGQNSAIEYEYIFLVQKKDYELAQAIITGKYIK